MPSILSEDDKETVKRVVPKTTNKIQAVAVARLYAAYPNRQKWTDTGLQGAVVLANDLVGNTYWIKMVDISPGNRGVIWDQEIYDTWSYNQDRTFFHTFELEECLAGLSFVDEKEAKQFLKKMNDREKNASKATLKTPFGGTTQNPGSHHKHGLFGSIFGGHRHSSAPTPPESPRTDLPPAASSPYHHFSRPSTGSTTAVVNGYRPSEFATLDAYDPDWREHFGQDLKDKGLTDDFIKENQDFIIEFLKDEAQTQQGQSQSARHSPPPPPPSAGVNGSSTSLRAPPPPPPGAQRSQSEAPAPPAPRRSGAPPAPPAPRRSVKSEAHVQQREPTPPRDPSPPPRPRFAVPPPLQDAGKFAHVSPPPRAPPAGTPGPPPPPRPPKTPIDERADTGASRYGVPPPFQGQRSVPPPPASRGPVPPPPPPREPAGYALPPGPPPPLPPKAPPAGIPQAPPLPPASSRPPAPGPSLPARHQASPLPPSNAPIPPPFPQSHAPPPPPAPPLPPPGAGAGPPPPPPPPPPPARGGVPPPPPPPPPPNRDSGYASGVPPTAAAIPPVDSTRSAVLDGIKGAGGIGALKKVDRSQIRDRSGAIVGGGSSGDTGPHGSGLPPSGVSGGGGGMADALAAALQKRKEKVSRSDDEDDDDDW